MSTEIPMINPEKRGGVSDNDRKFVVQTIDSEFLTANNATSYTLTTDWLVTDEDSETKLARKEFDDRTVELLYIAKVTTNGNRKSNKEPIDEQQYAELLDTPGLRTHVEKRRYEFKYLQNNVLFTVKYDEFTDSELRILEVDAPNEEDRNAFKFEDFPFALNEVTGKEEYYGYRVAALLTELQKFNI